MTSSWTRAPAWKNSMAVASRTRAGLSTPPAARVPPVREAARNRLPPLSRGRDLVDGGPGRAQLAGTSRCRASSPSTTACTRGRRSARSSGSVWGRPFGGRLAPEPTASAGCPGCGPAARAPAVGAYAGGMAPDRSFAGTHPDARPDVRRQGDPDAPRSTIPALLAAPDPALSFEFFPPKDDAGEATLWDAVRRLGRSARPSSRSPMAPAALTRDRTVTATERIAAQTTLTAMAHLTCVGASVAALRHVIGRYAAAGISNVWRSAVTRRRSGDSVAAASKGLDHAGDLVRLVRSSAGSPSGSPLSPTSTPSRLASTTTPRSWSTKEAAGAEFAITQFVFDVDAFLRLRDRAAARGPAPIVPSIMPVTSYPQLTRMAQLSGQPLPRAVTDQLDAVADDPAAVRGVGVQIATELTARLLREGPQAFTSSR